MTENINVSPPPMEICPTSGHEVAWDGTRVWVNHKTDGHCIARFAVIYNPSKPRLGSFEIELKVSPAEKELRDNQGQASKQETYQGGINDVIWNRWRNRLREIQQVNVPDKAMPTILKLPKE